MLGTVTEFKTNSFEIGVKSDTGETVFFPFGTDTQVVRIPPGERDLGKATPAAVTDILRAIASWCPSSPACAEARRIVLISSRDIVKRNEAEKLDWQNARHLRHRRLAERQRDHGGDSHAAGRPHGDRHRHGENQNPPLCARFREVQRRHAEHASPRSRPATRSAPAA